MSRSANAPGIPVQVASIEEAVAEADMLLTVTRAKEPLFDGKLVKEGALVAAIGASKSDVREVDDHLVSRAAEIVVEWKEQATREAGDLLLCKPGTFDWHDVRELG